MARFARPLVLDAGAAVGAVTTHPDCGAAFSAACGGQCAFVSGQGLLQAGLPRLLYQTL